MSTTNRLKRRRWLNKISSHTVAFIRMTLDREEWTTETGEGDEKIIEKTVTISGDIMIGDCRRLITLDFEGDANSRYKIRRLIEELQLFERTLIATMEE